MRKPVNNDLVVEWQRLVRQWNDTLALCEQATKASGGPRPGKRGRDAALEEARNRLNEIKRQMDAIVATGGARRGDQVIERDHLVVGTVAPGAEIAGSRLADPPARARQKATSRSK